MVVPGFLGRHEAARPRRAYLDNHTVQISTDASQNNPPFSSFCLSLPRTLHGDSSIRASSRASVQCAALQTCVEAGRHLHFSHLWIILNPQSPRPLFDGRPRSSDPRRFSFSFPLPLLCPHCVLRTVFSGRLQDPTVSTFLWASSPLSHDDGANGEEKDAELHPET